ncbi:GntR family transcriptional regulator [Aquibacillus sediminis]|uniref:GntR family transcriptional regulator n=1 Tax=Aquibacillus sediminis TaxID=2574734 RepID=UPI001FE83334|nr:GntR family transcriptional regulator [Aquibacillus sediminis]
MNKKQKAYNYMKTRIIEGYYAPGQRIVINQLAKELSTSAIPIREAVRQLEAEGLIEYKQNVGPVVTPINENEYLDTLSVLALMEGYATAMNHQNMSQQSIETLKEMNEDMKKSLEEFDFSEFGRLNRAFHDLTYQGCENKYLVDNIRKTWRRLDSIRVAGSTFNPKRAKASIEEHAEIIDLLQDQSSFEKIETAVRNHKLNTIEAYRSQKSKPNGTTFI